jgi:magnesium transporter
MNHMVPREMPDRQNVIALREWLEDHPPHLIADELGRADDVTSALLFRLLGKDRAIVVFEELDPVDQQKVLEGLRGQAFYDLVEAIDPDDRAVLLGEAPAKFAQRVLAGLSPRERTLTAMLLGYPEGSVGRIMSPEMVPLKRDSTVAAALSTVRAKGHDAETIYTLPVVDDVRHYIAVVTLRDLLLADPDARLADLMNPDIPTARATDNAEAAARLMQETNLLALPVVDSEARLVGLLTIDDAVEQIEAADTEDVARLSATEPWAGHYMSVSTFQLARNRAVWLLLLIVAATLTVNVLQVFESTLEQVTALALFIPLLIGTGGNAGAQAATAAVRALAVGEVRARDVFQVAWRECRVGVLLGAMLGVVAVGVGSIFVDFDIALVVGLSVVLVCAWAAVIGATMPLAAKRLGIDPAVISAPLVTTLVDATGLIIYFVIAQLILGV